MKRRTPAFVWILVIAAIVVPAAGFMYLVTTFLFAFSGGQYRMVAVVNYAGVVMLVLPALAAAVAWRLRSGPAAAAIAAVVSGTGWIATAVIEWLLSFSLGA